MRRKIAALTAIVYLACLLQSAVFDGMEIMGVKPNLLLVVAVSIALCRTGMESAFMGLFCGLGMDILIGRALGWYALCLFLVCFCIGLINPKLYKENFIIPVFFVFFSSVTIEMAYYFIHAFLEGYRDIVFVMSHLILPESVYNAVLAIPVYPLMLSVYRKMDKYDYVHSRL